ncbi:MAG: NAD-dependent epimerase/dehydratase family protein [Acidobacteriota bacterium]
MTTSEDRRVLITGAAGQLGSELVPALRRRYGADAVLATDIRTLSGAAVDGPNRRLDGTDLERFGRIAREHRATVIYHLVAVLSATGEKDPQRAWNINIGTLTNALEVARATGAALFVPSSIAAFGPSTPPDPTPQDTLQRPTSIYGVSKVAGELLCDYYVQRYGLDVRGVRYPGLISWAADPGGGTTDYAVEIFHQALTHNRYECFLRAGTQLDMMYMPDAVRAAIELMETPSERLTHRNAFNITAMQLTPEVLAAEIRRHRPDFELSYRVNERKQTIADSWPRRLDDSAARDEWGWQPRWDLEAMTADMLEHLAARLSAPAANTR